MRKELLLFLLFVSFSPLVFATHVRSGDLSYSYLGNNTFQVRIITYTELGNGSIAADQNQLPVNWGDGGSGNSLIVMTF